MSKFEVPDIVQRSLPALRWMARSMPSDAEGRLKRVLKEFATAEVPMLAPAVLRLDLAGRETLVGVLRSHKFTEILHLAQALDFIEPIPRKSADFREFVRSPREAARKQLEHFKQAYGID